MAYLKQRKKKEVIFKLKEEDKRLAEFLKKKWGVRFYGFLFNKFKWKPKKMNELFERYEGCFRSYPDFLNEYYLCSYDDTYQDSPDFEELWQQMKNDFMIVEDESKCLIHVFRRE